MYPLVSLSNLHKSHSLVLLQTRWTATQRSSRVSSTSAYTPSMSVHKVSSELPRALQTLADHFLPGNCLFHALADQLHGDPDRHLEIRARVIEHMREHGVYYKDFIGVFPGGGTRRNPRRSTTRSRQETPPPTAVEVDQAFERHLARMAEGGTFGDNLEVGAFARAYGVNVKIFQRDVAFFVTGESDDSAPKKTIHIAYHGPVSALAVHLTLRGPF